MTTDKPYTKLTANIPVRDMEFIDMLVREKKFASRTDVTREALRVLKRELLNNEVKEERK